MEQGLAMVPDYWELVSSLFGTGYAIFWPVSAGGDYYKIRVSSIERTSIDHGNKWQVKGETERGFLFHCEWTCYGSYQTSIKEGTLTIDES